MTFSYAQICSELLRGLSQKQKEVLFRRFGLAGKERETLESIGKDFSLTRERVRQIEKEGLFTLKTKIRNSETKAKMKVNPKGQTSSPSAVKKYQNVFSCFRQYFKKNGGLKKEDILLQDLGGKNWQNQVYFLLNLGEKFERFGETDDFHPFCISDQKSFFKARKEIDSILEKLKKQGKPLKLKDLKNGTSPDLSFLEISKKIQKNSEGLFGLKEWPEINPKGVKDKAFLVFKKTQKPLHFVQVAQFIDSALPQTVHNELIKDPRFVLVGRGIYALKEWGYEQGQVKDVISKILKEARNPLSKEEILEKTLKQRLVKQNTVFLNLSNKKYFFRTGDGRYTIQES